MHYITIMFFILAVNDNKNFLCYLDHLWWFIVHNVTIKIGTASILVPYINDNCFTRESGYARSIPCKFLTINIRYILNINTWWTDTINKCDTWPAFACIYKFEYKFYIFCGLNICVSLDNKIFWILIYFYVFL